MSSFQKFHEKGICQLNFKEPYILVGVYPIHNRTFKVDFEFNTLLIFQLQFEI